MRTKKQIALTVILAFFSLFSFGQGGALGNFRTAGALPLGWTGGTTPGPLDIRNSIAGQPINFFTGAAQRMIINGSTGPTAGFVGIGAPSAGFPNNLLDVKGDIDVNTPTSGYRIGDKYVLWHFGTTTDIFVGVGAGNATMIGHNNTLLGNNAGTNNYSGAQNTLIGSGAGNSNTQGGANTAVGYQALFQNTTLGGNTAIGWSALWRNQSFGNTAVGLDAMRLNITAFQNTAVGMEALRNNVDGVQNVAVGYRALRNNTGNQTSGAGEENTAVGNEVLENNSTGSRNTGLGDDVLAGNSVGDCNTGVGSEVLGFNSSGSFNTSVGQRSSTHNIDGNQNSVLGDSALFFSQHGSQNTVSGARAGFGVTNNSHSRNSFFGFESGVAITTGNDNTFAGWRSGVSNTTGSRNTLIGQQANTSSGILTNASAIGSEAIVNASNKMILGNDSVFVGIGLSNDGSQLGPQNKLEIDAGINSHNPSAGGAGASGLRFRDLHAGVNPNIALATNPFTIPSVLTVDANGDVILVRDQIGGGGGGTLGNPCGGPQNVLPSSWEIPLGTNATPSNFIFSSNNTTGNVGIGGYNCTPTDKLTILGNSLESNTGVHVTNITNAATSTAFYQLTNDIPGNSVVMKMHSSTYSSPSNFEITTPKGLDISPEFNSDINLKTASGVVNINSVTAGVIPAGTSLAVHATEVIENAGDAHLNINYYAQTAAELAAVSNGYGRLQLYKPAIIKPIISIPADGNTVYFNTGANFGIGTDMPGFMLDVAGTAHCTSGQWSSDSVLKTNIQLLASSALQKVKDLRPVSFEWITKRDTFMYGTQYGFTAQ